MWTRGKPASVCRVVAVRGAIESHLGSAQVSRVIYGAIIGLALVVGLEDHPPEAGVVAGFILATALAVALAELYSDIIGTETRTHARVERARVRSIATEAGAVAFGIGFPAAFFVLAAVERAGARHRVHDREVVRARR